MLELVEEVFVGAEEKGVEDGGRLKCLDFQLDVIQSPVQTGEGPVGREGRCCKKGRGVVD